MINRSPANNSNFAEIKTYDTTGNNYIYIWFDFSFLLIEKWDSRQL